ncbi:MAG: choice-of-anchor J domain-containing protein, partial [Thermoplasmatota archaeon]
MVSNRKQGKLLSTLFCLIVLLLTALQLPPILTPQHHGVAQATGNIVFSEGFDGFWPPPEWTITILNATATEPTGNWSQTTSGSYPTVTPYQGTAMAQYNSFTSPTGAQARLETPVFAATEDTHCTLTFYMYHSSYTPGAMDRLAVQLRTAATWTTLTTIDRYAENTGWQRHSITLDPIDTTFHLGFLGISDFGGNIYLDHVTLTEPYDIDIAVTAITQPTASYIHSGTATTITATLHNTGTTTQTNIPITLTITGPTSYTYQDTALLTDSLPANHSATIIFMPSWTAPATPGTYTLTVTSTLPGDQDHSNNATTKTLTVIGSNQLYESFEAWPPNQWTLADSENSGWQQTNSYQTPHSGTYTAYAPYGTNGSADAWLITPRLHLHDDETLTFWYTTKQGIPDSATLEVYLSTQASPHAIAGFKTRLWTTTTTTDTWTKATIPLNAYADTLGYIGFHLADHEDTMDAILLDDVYGPTCWSPTYDVAPLAVTEPAMGDTIGFHTVHASIQNYGQNTVSFPVDCSIYQVRDTVTTAPLTLVYHEDTTVGPLHGGATTDIQFTPAWNAAEYGYYIINISTELNSDQNPYNNHLEQPIYITLPSMTGLQIEKSIMDPPLKDWVDDYVAPQGSTVTMRIALVNTHTLPLYEINVTDLLPLGLTYANECTLNGDDTEPNLFNDMLIWIIPYLPPDGTATIQFDVTVTSCTSQINTANATAIIKDGTLAIGRTTDQDTATITPTDGTPPVTTMT